MCVPTRQILVVDKSNAGGGLRGPLTKIAGGRGGREDEEGNWAFRLKAFTARSKWE